LWVRSSKQASSFRNSKRGKDINNNNTHWAYGCPHPSADSDIHCISHISEEAALVKGRIKQTTDPFHLVPTELNPAGSISLVFYSI